MVAWSACAALPVQAEEAPELEATPASARLRLVVDGDDTRAGGQATRHYTVLLRGEAIRIQPETTQGMPASSTYLLKTGPGPGAWLRDDANGMALPVPDASGPYWYDPRDPCARIGGRCEPAPPEVIAGQFVRGWRYRASPQGPDGSRDGVLWLDAETGLLLGYRAGSTAGQEPRRMQVTEVLYEPMPADLFTAPGEDAGQVARKHSRPR